MGLRVKAYFQGCIERSMAYSVCNAFLSVFLFVCKKNFNMNHNFWIVSDRAFIYHMYIPCEKTFSMVSR